MADSVRENTPVDLIYFFWYYTLSEKKQDIKMITNLTFQGDIISTKSPKAYFSKFAVIQLQQTCAQDIAIGEEMSGE